MPTEIVRKYAHVWGEDPTALLREYVYQAALTNKLASIDTGELNLATFYEMVLWKLNRFPVIDGELLAELGTVKAILPSSYKDVEPILKRMLQCAGIALPMASTILRFLNPNTFQIIDDRVYRIVLPGRVKYPSKPTQLNQAYLDNSVRIYFEYLGELRKLSCDELPYSKADRILYQLDIKLGNQIGDKG